LNHPKRPVIHQLIYFVSPRFTPELVEFLFVNKFFGFIIYLVIMGLPFYILLTPQYWNFFSQSPKYYFSTFFFFFFPFVVIASQKFLRNPFFLFPFSTSFVLSTQTPIYFHFFEIFLFFIGVGIYSLVETRTSIPYIFTEYILESTTFFTGYQDAHNYWKLILKILVPLFLFICFILKYWS